MASGGWDIDACLGRLNNANDLGWRAWECCKKSEYRPGKIHKRRSDSNEIFIKSNLFVETLGYYFEIENSSTMIDQGWRHHGLMLRPAIKFYHDNHNSEMASSKINVDRIFD